MSIKQLKALLLLMLIAGLLRGSDRPEGIPATRGPAATPAPAAPPPPGQLEDLLGRHKELIDALVEALHDAEPDVRETTMLTLGRIGKRAIPSLIESLRDKERDQRANAAYVLALLGKDAQEAVPSLLIALKDGDREVRRRAVYALYRIVDGTTVVDMFCAEPNRLRCQAKDPGLLMPSSAVSNLPIIRSNSKPVTRP